jgi:hypothetical protein
MQRAIRSLMLAMLVVGASSGLAAAKDFVINPQAGLMASHRSDDPSDITTHARVGYLFGGNLRFGGGQVYLAPGVYFQRSNIQLTQKDTLTTNNLEDIVGVQSVHIPLLVGVNMSDNPTGSGLGFRLFGGPALNLVTKVQSNDFGVEKSDFKSTNVGIMGGAGFDLSRVTVDVSYEASLSKVMENSDVRQQSLRGAFGIKF